MVFILWLWLWIWLFLWIWLWQFLNLHHNYKFDNICTLTQVGEYRKILAFGLRSFLGLRPREVPRPYTGIFLYFSPFIKVQTQNRTEQKTAGQNSNGQNNTGENRDWKNSTRRNITRLNRTGKWLPNRTVLSYPIHSQSQGTWRSQQEPGAQGESWLADTHTT